MRRIMHGFRQAVCLVNRAISRVVKYYAHGDFRTPEEIERHKEADRLFSEGMHDLFRELINKRKKGEDHANG